MTAIKPGKLIKYSADDIFVNLALDEVLLREAESNHIPIIRIWQNPPSVILGRGQDLEQEVDVDYCHQQYIQIARRIPGGGCVFQDFGNWNISFIFPLSAFGKSVDILKMTIRFTHLIISVLQNIGFSGLSLFKNGNILFESKKISGSAGYKLRNWYLHHLTVMNNTNLNHLNLSLLARKSDPHDKRASQYYPTTNLKSLSIEEFMTDLTILISTEFRLELEVHNVNKATIEKAHQLSVSLYSTKEWIHQGRRKKLT